MCGGPRELQRSLGEAGELEPETESILAEYEIFDDEFSEDVLAVLPEEEPWIVPQVLVCAIESTNTCCRRK